MHSIPTAVAQGLLCIRMMPPLTVKEEGGERMKHDGGGPDRGFLITPASPSTLANFHSLLAYLGERGREKGRGRVVERK